MKKTWLRLLPFIIIGFIAFCTVAVNFEFITLNILPASFIGALFGALISAIITQYLLTGQTAHQEVKECNVTIFSKKYEIFLKYINDLWKILDKQGLSIDDYDNLRRDFSTKLMIYLNEKENKSIANFLYEIGKFVNNSNEDYNNLKSSIFNIVNMLSGSINLGGKIDIDIDNKLEEAIYPKLFKQSILNELNKSFLNSSEFNSELDNGRYVLERDLIDDGKYGGEYISFDFRRFKGCKLLIGSFSKYCPYGSVWMMLFIEKNIHSVDKFRYNEDDFRPSEFDKYVIGIWPNGGGDENWVELTCAYDNEEYMALGDFPPPPKKKGLYFDDLNVLEHYRNKYRKVAHIIGKRASYRLKNSYIWNEDGKEEDEKCIPIIKFLEEYIKN